MTDQKKDLDHDQQTTDTLAKSVRPSNDFLKAEGVCKRCHGKLRRCERADCPQGG